MDQERPKVAPDARLPADARRRSAILTFEDGSLQGTEDNLAVECPLEIHIAGAAPIITMRTPGHDRELAAGLLYSEGVVRSAADIVYLEHQAPNVVRVMLRTPARQRLERLARTDTMTSGCGICGKARVYKPEREPPAAPAPTPEVSPAWLLGLPRALRAAQGIFELTGGLHAAALFAPGGTLLSLREDVGRHNALDKLIGEALFAGQLPLAGQVVMLSGRTSYELLQKVITAGAPIVAAISAPSSLAVDLATEFGITLIGFMRGGRFNVYAGAQRLAKSKQ